MNTTTKREKQHLEILLSLFFLLLLVLHFALTIAYQFRELNYTSRLASLSKQYTEPLFTQNFKIFAPDVPEIKYKLFVRYASDGKNFSSWQNVGAPLILKHQQNRISSSGYEYLIYKNAITELLRAHSDAVERCDKTLPSNLAQKQLDLLLRNSIHFYKASYCFNQQWMRAFQNKPFPKSFECALLLEKIAPVNNKFEVKNSKYTYLFFPKVELVR